MVSESQFMSRGFSLLETLIAMALTLGVGAVAFQLFHQDEQIFRDQILILEMQQTARMLLSQIEDDIRIAGQCLPPGSGSIVLPGSSATTLLLRGSFTAIERQTTTTLPFDIVVGTPGSLRVEQTTGFSTGREIYVWIGAQWIRATILSVSGPAKTLSILPTQGSASIVTFNDSPVAANDEGIAILYDANKKLVRRATSQNTMDPENPAWGPANEVATNVIELSFRYFDELGNLLDMEAAGSVERILSVEVWIRVQSAEVLTNGTRPIHTMVLRVTSRNAALR